MEKSRFITLIILCFLTHIIRTIYEILKHRQILNPGKLSFVIILTNMMVLWVSWFVLCSQDIYRVYLPAVIRYAGITLFVLGGVAFFTALITIRTLESYDGDLITKGIYSKIRHPMYLGFIFWLIGFPVFFGALVPMMLCVIFIANVLFWRHLEEIELVNRFPGYREYRKTTVF
jgi:protein-S-isoprenylcysteine O-methyltransferase Ste14